MGMKILLIAKIMVYTHNLQHSDCIQSFTSMINSLVYVSCLCLGMEHAVQHSPTTILMLYSSDTFELLGGRHLCGAALDNSGSLSCSS